MKHRDHFAFSVLVALVVTIGGSVALVTLADPGRPASVPTRTRPTSVAVLSAPEPSSETPIVVAATRVPPTATATVTPAPSPTATLAPVVITVTNAHCGPIEYRVDDVTRVTDLEAGLTATFQTEPGEHSAQVCRAGADACDQSTPVSWTRSTDATVERGNTCPITVTVVNSHCDRADLFVDGQLTVISVPQGESATFQTRPGKHALQACPAGTQFCGDITSVEWTDPITFSIEPAQSCP